MKQVKLKKALNMQTTQFMIQTHTVCAVSNIVTTKHLNLIFVTRSCLKFSVLKAILS